MAKDQWISQFFNFSANNWFADQTKQTTEDSSSKFNNITNCGNHNFKSEKECQVAK